MLAAAALCELCGREIVGNPAEHYRGHLENAQGYLHLIERLGGDRYWSAKARAWIERCETVLADLEPGTVN